MPMDELQALFRQYGLWVVFFGTMIEGDLTLLLAGVLARSGLFSFQDALLVGTSGGVAGDLIGYLIGRGFRSRARTLRFYLRAKPRIERLMRRFGGFTLFIVKYTYGLRTAMSVFCGLAHFGAQRFAPLALLSCLTWVVVLAGLGYFFTGTIEKVIGDIHRIEKVALVFVVILAIVFAGKHYLKHYRIGRSETED
jgi:membrane protein DedA with SNARE-associated domain